MISKLINKYIYIYIDIYFREGDIVNYKENFDEFLNKLYLSA